MSARPLAAAALFLAALALCPSPSPADEGESDQASPALIPMGGLMLFYNSKAPLSMVSSSPKGRPAGAVDIGEISGRSCQNGFSLPLSLSLNAMSLSAAVGNGSYEKIFADLKRLHPELAGLYDIRVDLHLISVLGLYRRMCTELTGRGFRQGD